MVLRKDEERLLIIEAQKGDIVARNKLIENNYGLINRWAIKFLPVNDLGRAYTIDDLFQEGVIGYIDAINRFDLSRSTCLNTYAYYRVRKAFSDYIRRRSLRVVQTEYDDENAAHALFEQEQEDKESRYELLLKLLDKLKERDRLLIKLRFFQKLTLSECAVHLQVSKARTQQIEKAIIKRLQKLILEGEDNACNSSRQHAKRRV